MTCILGERTKVIAHPGDKWKAGYFTFSRLATSRNSWRSTHLSKRAFEKFCENIENIHEAIKNHAVYQLMLNKKQHILISHFKREGQETLYYVSILHPTTEHENLTNDTEINHAKTINLSVSEFEKLKINVAELIEVVRSKVEKPDEQESTLIQGFRWKAKDTGERCDKIFIDLLRCKKDAEEDYINKHSEQMQTAPASFSIESFYEYETVHINRSSKLELIEHMVYRTLQMELLVMSIDIRITPPSYREVDTAIHNMEKSFIRQLVKQALIQLKYRNVYMVNELIDIFFYTQGMELVKETLKRHKVSPSCLPFARLLNGSYQVITESMKTL